MQGPAPARLGEQLRSTPVREPRLSRVAVRVYLGHWTQGGTGGQEQRAACAVTDQAGNQARRAGGPVHVLDVAALADDASGPFGEVEVLDVEREHLVGAC